MTPVQDTRKLPGPTRGRDRTSIAELLADERCSQAVLQFFATTDLGRTSGPPTTEDGEDAASEVSEWEARDQRSWLGRGERGRRGWGRSRAIFTFFTHFNFLYSLCLSFTLPVRFWRLGPHHDGDLFFFSFIISAFDLYRSWQQITKPFSPPLRFLLRSPS